MLKYYFFFQNENTSFYPEMTIESLPVINCTSWTDQWFASMTTAIKILMNTKHATSLDLLLIYLWLYMYTDVLHRLQILKSTSLLYKHKVLALIKQKQTAETLWTLTWGRHVLCVVGFCFVRMLLEGFTFFIFTHRDKYIRFKRFYKLIQQFKDTQTLLYLHTAGTGRWMKARRLKSALIKRLMLAFWGLTSHQLIASLSIFWPHCTISFCIQDTMGFHWLA